MRKKIIVAFVVFCLAILGLPMGMFVANGLAARRLLIESIAGQLNAVTAAAAEIVYEDGSMQAFTSRGDFFLDGTDWASLYNADGENGGADGFDGMEFVGAWEHMHADYRAAIVKLRGLVHRVAECATDGERRENPLTIKYIYTVIRTGADEYRFVFDTDEDELTPFKLYALDPSQRAAFDGATSASMEVKDEWGSFHTGSRPLVDETGQVFGIVCADIEDGMYRQSIREFNLGVTLICTVPTLILTAFAIGLIALLNNIRRMQENLSRMAHFDKLTDIPNRRYLLEQLETMTTAKKPLPFALFFIDLDNFKMVNDNAGHDAGDELLRHIAGYLQGVHLNSSVFRPGAGRVSVTARVGGDEFIIIAPGIEDSDSAEAYAREILDGFTLTVKDKYALQYRVGLSIGAAFFPAHTRDYTRLIACADTAMYHAKRNGKNSYRLFTEEMLSPPTQN